MRDRICLAKVSEIVYAGVESSPYVQEALRAILCLRLRASDVLHSTTVSEGPAGQDCLLTCPYKTSGSMLREGYAISNISMQRQTSPLTQSVGPRKTPRAADAPSQRTTDAGLAARQEGKTRNDAHLFRVGRIKLERKMISKPAIRFNKHANPHRNGAYPSRNTFEVSALISSPCVAPP